MLPARHWIPAAVIVALAVAGLFFYGRPHGSKSSVGQYPSAPDFSLKQLNGVSLELSSYRGKVVLLDFWATWYDPCREEIPHFVELQQKYGGDGLQIIGVSMDDSTDPVGPFAEKYRMNYPIVMGNAKTGELYGGVLGLPITFVIDRDGRIYAKHIGATNVNVFENEITHLLKSN